VHAFAMGLALLRRLPQFDRQVRAGQWLQKPERVPRRLSTLTCGVVGLGSIGAHYARLARTVFGTVAGYDPGLPADAWPAGVEPSPSLDDLVTRADCLSLHLPLTDQTRGLIGADQLAALPPGAVLVNTSRAGLVDQPALVSALDRGHLGGCALDVLPAEPPAAGDPILVTPHTLLSPHSAFLSQESLLDYALVPARNVATGLDTPVTPSKGL